MAGRNGANKNEEGTLANVFSSCSFLSTGPTIFCVETVFGVGTAWDLI